VAANFVEEEADLLAFASAFFVCLEAVVAVVAPAKGNASD
jgi:hypothetical protein